MNSWGDKLSQIEIWWGENWSPAKAQESVKKNYSSCSSSILNLVSKRENLWWWKFACLHFRYAVKVLEGEREGVAGEWWDELEVILGG